jgi:hypothetical protein
MTLDPAITGIVLLVLQIVQLMLQSYVSFHSAQKARTAKSRNIKREEMHSSVRFLTTKHEAVDQRTLTLQQWMDLLLTHKGLEHSSSTPSE